MIINIEINHQRAPLELRERLSFSEEEIPAALGLLLNGHGLSAPAVLRPTCDPQDCTTCNRARFREAAILSTCNRTAIYGLGGCPEPLARFLACYKDSEPAELRSYLVVYENQSAVEHLFTIAAGLDSQVIGEPQILGQVRRAYELAAEATGSVLDQFFRRAIQVGKRVRTETDLGRYPASLASVAVELANQVRPALSGVSALLIGTGEMGELVAGLLRKRGIHKLLIASRSWARAAALARRLEAQPLGFERLDETLAQVDIVMSATDTDGFVVTAPQVAEALRHRDRPLLLIDLGLPRNLDPQIRALSRASLHDLDDLKAISEAGLRRRQQEIPKARHIVAEETEAFLRWLREQRATPVIKALHDHAETIRQEQMRWALPKLGSLSPHQQRVVEALTTRLVSKLLHTPTKQLKTLAQQAESCEPFILLKHLFGLKADPGDAGK